MYHDKRAYNVDIEAEDENGNKITFVEVASYEGMVRGPVPEDEREAKAVQQVRARMPHLRSLRATHSSHV